MKDFSLKFVTRPGCHLCAEAEPIVRRAAERAGVGVEAVDIDSEDELIRRYSMRIPVVLGPDGDVIDEGAISEQPLRKAIRRARRRHRPRRGGSA